MEIRTCAAWRLALGLATALAMSCADDGGIGAAGVAGVARATEPLVWQEQNTLVASDGAAGDWFGASLAFEGDTAVVGAAYDDVEGNEDQGSATVFVRRGGAWSEQQRLLASDGAAGDQFGYAVAISGDTLVIGAIADTVEDRPGQGSAYVFALDGDTWVERQHLVASDGASNDQFTQAIALDGDTLAISCYLAEIDGREDQGAVFVFARDGGTWVERQKLTASDGTVQDRLGVSVALEGDTLVAGSWRHAVEGRLNQGAVYIFERSGDSWTQTQQLVAPDGAAGDAFGESLALDGDTLAVGAPIKDIDGVADVGAAYLFTRSGTWMLAQELLAVDGALGDSFGAAVALEGDLLLVGGDGRDVDGRTRQGAAWAFTRGVDSWSELALLVAADGVAGDRYGVQVALSGRTALVAAYLGDVGAAVDQGAVAVFEAFAEQGEPSGASDQCLAGPCVDGVCCDGECGGGDATDCQACAVALGAAADGVCGPLTESVAPTIECRPAADACDVAETCTSELATCPAADAKLDDGTECDDGLDFTTGDACSAGTCLGTEQGSCDAPVACEPLPFTHAADLDARASHVDRYDDGCARSSLAGSDVVYELRVGAGERIVVEVVPDAALDVVVAVLDACGESQDCLAWADEDGEGGAESVEVSAESASTFAVVVEGEGAGGYQLSAARIGGGGDGDADADADADAGDGGDEGCSCRGAGGRAGVSRSLLELLNLR